MNRDVTIEGAIAVHRDHYGQLGQWLDQHGPAIAPQIAALPLGPEPCPDSTHAQASPPRPPGEATEATPPRWVLPGKYL